MNAKEIVETARRVAEAGDGRMTLTAKECEALLSVVREKPDAGDAPRLEAASLSDQLEELRRPLVKFVEWDKRWPNDRIENYSDFKRCHAELEDIVRDARRLTSANAPIEGQAEIIPPPMY